MFGRLNENWRYDTWHNDTTRSSMALDIMGASLSVNLLGVLIWPGIRDIYIYKVCVCVCVRVCTDIYEYLIYLSNSVLLCVRRIYFESSVLIKNISSPLRIKNMYKPTV
jgi:hypothetical protein